MAKTAKAASKVARPERAIKIGASYIPLEVSTNLPTVYFELIAAINILPGMVEVVLATGITLPVETGGVEVVAQATAVLKCNVVAAAALRDMLNRALAPPEQPKGRPN